MGTASNTLREALAEVWKEWPNIRQLIEGWAITTPANEWSEWDEATRQASIKLTGVIDAALSAPQGQGPTRSEFNRHCSICGRKCSPTDHNGFRAYCPTHGHVDAKEVMPTEPEKPKSPSVATPSAAATEVGAVTPPGVEQAGSDTLRMNLLERKGIDKIYFHDGSEWNPHSLTLRACCDSDLGTLLDQALESQRNDTRTPEQIAIDGASFIANCPLGEDGTISPTPPGVESGSGHECAARTLLKTYLRLNLMEHQWPEIRKALAQPYPAPLSRTDVLRRFVELADRFEEFGRLAASHLDSIVKDAQSVAGSEDTALLEYWYSNPDLYFVRRQDGTVALHANDHDFMEDPEVTRGKDFRECLRAAIAQEKTR